MLTLESKMTPERWSFNFREKVVLDSGMYNILPTSSTPDHSLYPNGASSWCSHNCANASNEELELSSEALLEGCSNSKMEDTSECLLSCHLGTADQEQSCFAAKCDKSCCWGSGYIQLIQEIGKQEHTFRLRLCFRQIGASRRFPRGSRNPQRCSWTMQSQNRSSLNRTVQTSSITTTALTKLEFMWGTKWSNRQFFSGPEKFYLRRFLPFPVISYFIRNGSGILL